MKITILGGGSWGTALAVHLAKKKHEVRVWEFFEEMAQAMQEGRKCKFLPDVPLSKNITISNNMENMLEGTELIILAVPSDKVEETIEEASSNFEEQPVIICSKGFASNLRLLSEVVEEKVKGPVYCLYGPTHAEEVCKGEFSGIVLAGDDIKEDLKEVIESDDLKVDTSGDIIGVQIAAALKNIVAVFAGVLDGMGLGDNAKAFIMTKGLEEIKEVGLKWGAHEETFHGLAGIGDIIVTCVSLHSRNRFLGQEIGKGRKLQKVIDEMEMIAEGVTTLKQAIELRDKFDLELPLISGLYEILFEKKDPKDVLAKL